MTTDTNPTDSPTRGGHGAARFLKNVLLFLASPFIALSYLVALPVFGLYQFVKAARDKKNTAA